jgi:hypothetical protein
LKSYDSTTAPNADEWLATDEGERIELVVAYHRRVRIRVPRERLHATIHVVVENQIATGEAVVIETLGRLQREGLDRHDAVHAIGKVLAEHLYDLLQATAPGPAQDVNAPYFDALRVLSAESWRNAG